MASKVDFWGAIEEWSTRWHHCFQTLTPGADHEEDLLGRKITFFLFWRKAGGLVHDSSYDFVPKDISNFKKTQDLKIRTFKTS